MLSGENSGHTHMSSSLSVKYEHHYSKEIKRTSGENLHRYTKNKKEVTQAYCKRKSSIHKGRNKKKKWTEMNYKNNQKTSNKMAIST